MRKFVAAVALGVAGSMTLAACGGSNASQDKTLVVATHDSWNMPKNVIAEFEKKSGWKVKIQPQGDAGALTNKLVLTKNSPIADVAYGVDNTFASRALENKVFDKVGGSGPASASKYDVPGADSAKLAPIDYSDVCVNVDNAWFAKAKKTPPKNLDDLTKPAYLDLFVTPGANTSSPGMAFLVATIGTQKDGWPDYWKKLVKNGAKVTNGWNDAYQVDFTAGEGKGTRPIVLSYSSSPPFTIPKGGAKPTTSALLDTCFRQVEYAGVLAGSDKQEAAGEFVRFLQSPTVQTALPDNMYVYPINSDVKVPQAWAKWAPPASKPVQVSSEEITKNRDAWLRSWRDIVSG